MSEFQRNRNYFTLPPKNPIENGYGDNPTNSKARLVELAGKTKKQDQPNNQTGTEIPASLNQNQGQNNDNLDSGSGSELPPTPPGSSRKSGGGFEGDENDKIGRRIYKTLKRMFPEVVFWYSNQPRYGQAIPFSIQSPNQEWIQELADIYEPYLELNSESDMEGGVEVYFVSIKNPQEFLKALFPEFRSRSDQFFERIKRDQQKRFRSVGGAQGRAYIPLTDSSDPRISKNVYKVFDAESLQENYPYEENLKFYWEAVKGSQKLFGEGANVVPYRRVKYAIDRVRKEFYLIFTMDKVDGIQASNIENNISELKAIPKEHFDKLHDDLKILHAQQWVWIDNAGENIFYKRDRGFFVVDYMVDVDEKDEKKQDFQGVLFDFLFNNFIGRYIQKVNGPKGKGDYINLDLAQVAPFSLTEHQDLKQIIHNASALFGQGNVANLTIQINNLISQKREEYDIVFKEPGFMDYEEPAAVIPVSVVNDKLVSRISDGVVTINSTKNLKVGSYEINVTVRKPDGSEFISDKVTILKKDVLGENFDLVFVIDEGEKKLYIMETIEAQDPNERFLRQEIENLSSDLIEDYKAIRGRITNVASLITIPLTDEAEDEYHEGLYLPNTKLISPEVSVADRCKLAQEALAQAWNAGNNEDLASITQMNFDPGPVLISRHQFSLFKKGNLMIIVDPTWRQFKYNNDWLDEYIPISQATENLINGPDNQSNILFIPIDARQNHQVIIDHVQSELSKRGLEPVKHLYYVEPLIRYLEGNNDFDKYRGNESELYQQYMSDHELLVEPLQDQMRERRNQEDEIRRDIRLVQETNEVETTKSVRVTISHNNFLNPRTGDSIGSYTVVNNGLNAEIQIKIGDLNLNGLVNLRTHDLRTMKKITFVFERYDDIWELVDLTEEST